MHSSTKTEPQETALTPPKRSFLEAHSILLEQDFGPKGQNCTEEIIDILSTGRPYTAEVHKARQGLWALPSHWDLLITDPGKVSL